MIGNSLSGITFAGLSSGIDSDAIVTRLIAIESIPIRRLRAQQDAIRGRQSLLQQLRTQISALNGAASGLDSAAAFSPIAGSSSKPEVASVSVGQNAAQGTYALAVSKLAQAHKVSSSAQTDATSALGQAGILVVNGKGVSIEASDSLTAIAQKINGAGAGVIASILNGGAGNAFLTLTSSKSGASNGVQIANLTGTVATSLGIAAGADGIRESIANGATSAGFSSSTAAIGTLLGATGLTPTSFEINGVSVSVDLQTQSLAEIANAINAAATGATASVRSVTTDGVTSYKLDISGASTPTFADTDGTLKAIGILQAGFGNQLVAAQDAAYSLDGVSLTSASNTVTGVIPDVTLTLLKANETTPETSTLTFTQDNTAVKNKVKAFLSAYNAIVDFIKANSRFDKDTFAAGPLFADSLARQAEAELSGTIFSNIAGLTGPYSNLAELGFGFEQDGKLKLDESVLDAALASNSNAVGEVFRARGEGTVSSIQFVSSTSKTRPSGAGFYDVSITQLATKGSYTAEAAQTSNTVAVETLTFSGSLFGSQDHDLVIPIGSSQAAIVDLINADARLKDLVIATVEGGSLKIASKKYGSNGNFAVVSDLAAAADNSGIGTSEAGTKVVGVDVAGTINGEPATGNGQYLTGDADNPNTDGLQILYTGTATGAVGSIRFTKGVAALTSDLALGFTDTLTGVFAVNDQSLQSQIDSIDKTIDDLETRIALKEQSLRRRFAAMEQAIAQLQAQQLRLAQLTALRSNRQ